MQWGQLAVGAASSLLPEAVGAAFFPLADNWGSLPSYRQFGQPSLLLTVGTAPAVSWGICPKLGQPSLLLWGQLGQCFSEALNFWADWRNLSAAAWCLGQLRSIWAWAAYSPSSCSSTTMADQKQVPSRPLVPPLGKDAAASNVFYRKMQVCMVVV